MRLQRAVVIGAGPAGLATAIAARKAGLETMVVERAAELGAAGSGLTLWPNGLRALDSFGAGDAVRAAALASPGISMRTSAGRVLSELSGPALESVGGPGVALRRSALVRALADLLGPGSIRFGGRCVGVRSEPDRAVASLADGTELAADLVIGADGLRSATRASCGLGAPLRYAGFTVWRAVVRYELAPLPGMLSLGGCGQFGLWRIPGDRVYWFASVPAPEGVHGSGRSRPPEWFSGWHEPIPELLAATATHQITATDIYDSRPLRAWSSGRVALVGDAAHPSLPNMGQGTSQAFEDAAALGRCLAAELGLPAALRAYEALRRRRARAAWSQARLMARLGGWSNPAACWARHALLAAVPRRAQLRQLRRLFAFDLADAAVPATLAAAESAM